MSIGRILQEARFAKHLSVDSVADQANMAVGTLRAYEHGRRMPSAEAFKKLIPVLEIDGIWLSNSTWHSRETDELYNLAPRNGGAATSDKVTSDELSTMRVRAIKAILETDSNKLLAVITLLENSS
jgi:transcriptional regulator with XRE-family HTH domain